MQTLPPLDEYIPALMTRPILIYYKEQSPLLTPPTPQRILVPQQDRAAEEPKIETSQELSIPIEDRSSDSKTPICQVQPVLGMTTTENLQLRDRNQPEDIADILGTTAFRGFKTSLKTEFKHLKEVTSHNVQNRQISLSIQQTYSSTLCSHVNNIYSKLSKLQKLIQHHCMYSHQGDSVQIEAPEFDPDIDGDSPVSTDQKPLSQRMTIAFARSLFLPNYARSSCLFLLELCINIYCATLGNVARVYPWIVQGLMFLSA